MKIINFMMISIFSFALQTRSSAAEPIHPENGGDGVGLRVRLEVPWTTGMFSEKFPYHYILENFSNKPISMAIPYKKHGLGIPWGGQAFLEPDQLGHEPRFSIHTASWPPINADLTPPEAWTELMPGERISWNRNRIPASHFSTIPPNSLQAHWLLDEGRWISSEIVEFQKYDVYAQRRTIFKQTWSPAGNERLTGTGEAYIVNIGNEYYLFWNKNRVARVAVDDEFEHQVDEHGTT